VRERDGPCERERDGPCERERDGPCEGEIGTVPVREKEREGRSL